MWLNSQTYWQGTPSYLRKSARTTSFTAAEYSVGLYNFTMSSLTRHVAKQPNLLAADADWRQQLSEVIRELKKNMPGIKRLLFDSKGNDHDAVVLRQADGYTPQA